MYAMPRSRLRRLMLAAVPGALAISILAAGHGAAAGFFGDIAIIDADTGQQTIIDSEPHVCGFWLEFDFDRTVDMTSWEIRQWNGSPAEGATVLGGSGGPTDADGKLRQPASGSLSLPDGHYNILWDDEGAVDESFGHQSFIVDCSASGGTQPTPTDSGTDLAAGGGGGAAGLTPPPTDTTAETAGTSSSIVPVAISLLAMLTLAFTVSAQRLVERSGRRRR